MKRFGIPVLGNLDCLHHMAKDAKIWQVVLERFEAHLGNSEEGSSVTILMSNMLHIVLEEPGDHILSVEGLICRVTWVEF